MTDEIIVNIDRPLGNAVRDGLLTDLNLVDKAHQRRTVERFKLRVKDRNSKRGKTKGSLTHGQGKRKKKK